MADGRSSGLARRAPEKPRPLAVSDADHPGHTHKLPRVLLALLVIIGSGLVVSIVLVSVLAVQANHRAEETNRRLTALEQFIADRGEQRDQQNRTLDERITSTVCDVLEALPAGGLLDEVRAENGCGPGVPIEELSPEARADLQRYADGAPLTTTDEPFSPDQYYAEPESTDDARLPVVPEPDRKAPRTPPESTNAASPTPTVVAPPMAPDVPTAAPTSAPPVLDVPRLANRLCALTGVCP